MLEGGCFSAAPEKIAQVSFSQHAISVSCFPKSALRFVMAIDSWGTGKGHLLESHFHGDVAFLSNCSDKSAQSMV